MKLSEIIEKVKHDADRFDEPASEFQAGRAWEALKILDMLYQFQSAQLNHHSVMQGPFNCPNPCFEIRMVKNKCLCNEKLTTGPTVADGAVGQNVRVDVCKCIIPHPNVNDDGCALCNKPYRA